MEIQTELLQPNITIEHLPHGSDMPYRIIVQNNPVNFVDPHGLLTVHIWEYRGKSEAWGHASLTLENGTHISWWPAAEGRTGALRFLNIYSANPNDPQTFADDVSLEGQKPDYQIKIIGLDEKSIEKWWLNYKKSNQWTTLSANCSTISSQALKAGGANKYASWSSSHNMIWTPNDVKDLSHSIRKNLGYKSYGVGGSW